MLLQVRLPWATVCTNIVCSYFIDFFVFQTVLIKTCRKFLGKA